MQALKLFALFFLISGGFFTLSAAGPEALPLVQKGKLEYLGAFRLPRGGDSATESFSFGGNAIAFDPADGGLFVSSRGSFVAKVSIPPVVKSVDVETLPFASFIQGFKDPLEGGRAALGASSIRGLLVADGKLFGTDMIYYDANNSARVSTFSRSTDLSQTSATPLKALWQAEKSGYVAGWLANVPQEWQPLLGGSVLSGNCCVPIVSRTSQGPSAFAWNPADFAKSPVPATPLLYYPGEHETLGPWSGSNEVYGGTTQIGGMVIPAGTRSLLYFGLNGIGKFCYGTGGASGGECVDPLSSAKGQHAYPYRYQVWAYDLVDLAKAKSKQIEPWEIKPYAVWTLDDFPEIFVSGIGGVAYDAEKQLIYVSQASADKDGYSSRALIHAFKVRNAAPKPLSIAPPAVIAPAPTPREEAVVLPGTVSAPEPSPAKQGFIETLIRFLRNLKNRV